MSTISKINDKAHQLIHQNTNKRGGTKLLVRARELKNTDKVVRTYTTRKGHELAEIRGSNGDLYEVWFYLSGRVYCQCSFFNGLDPIERQQVGCKHVLAQALMLLDRVSQ